MHTANEIGPNFPQSEPGQPLNRFNHGRWPRLSRGIRQKRSRKNSLSLSQFYGLYSGFAGVMITDRRTERYLQVSTSGQEPYFSGGGCIWIGQSCAGRSTFRWCWVVFTVCGQGHGENESLGLRWYFGRSKSYSQACEMNLTEINQD